MRRMLLVAVMLVAVGAWTAGCSGNGGGASGPADVADSADAPRPDGPGEHAGETSDVVPDTPLPETVADLPPQGEQESEAVPEVSAGQPGTVLLLDLEMRAPVSWAFLVGQLQGMGHEVVYRRWFPHVTKQDVSPDSGSGKLPFSIIVVSSGNGPSEPSERMRVQGAENLVAYLEVGGTVLLLVRHTWADGYGGDSEWLLFNRVLEGAGAKVRVARNTAIGFVSQPSGGKPPLHQAHPAAYPGSLEWTINYPMAYADAQHPAMADAQAPYAGGVTSTVACDGDEAAVLAWTHKNVLLWGKLDNSPSAVEIPLKQQPLAVLAPAAGGFVGVLPRSAVQLPVHTEYMSDKPVLDLALLDAAADSAAAALARLSAVSRGAAGLDAQGCHVTGKEGLFSASGKDLPPIGKGTEVKALFPPSFRDVPPAPPEPPAGAPPLAEGIPTGTAGSVAVPSWYRNGRARMGYGGYRPYEEIKPFFAKAVAAGMDSFVVTVDAAWLYGMAADQPGEPHLEGLALAAQETGAKLFLGVTFLTGAYTDLAAQVGQATGSDGQQLKAPPPLSDLYWEKAVLPLYVGAAKAAKLYAGILGLHVDTELYGAGSLWYAQGYAFDPDTWARVLALAAALSPGLAAEGESLPPAERLAWMVDRGIAAAVFQGLEEQAAGKAAAVREAARAIHPELELAFYEVMISTAWFYRGLMKGLGTPDRPVTVLSYDIATNEARKVFHTEGIPVRIIGGLLGVLFKPEDFEKGLHNAGLRSDGYWQFQFTDFPVSWDPANPPKLHGTPDAYWGAVAEVNALLDAESPL